MKFTVTTSTVKNANGTFSGRINVDFEAGVIKEFFNWTDRYEVETDYDAQFRADRVASEIYNYTLSHASGKTFHRDI